MTDEKKNHKREKFDEALKANSVPDVAFEDQWYIDVKTNLKGEYDDEEAKLKLKHRCICSTPIGRYLGLRNTMNGHLIYIGRNCMNYLPEPYCLLAKEFSSSGQSEECDKDHTQTQGLCDHRMKRIIYCRFCPPKLIYRHDWHVHLQEAHPREWNDYQNEARYDRLLGDIALLKTEQSELVERVRAVRNIELKFGKYFGKTLKEVQDEDSKYWWWLNNHCNNDFLRTRLGRLAEDVIQLKRVSLQKRVAEQTLEKLEKKIRWISATID